MNTNAKRPAFQSGRSAALVAAVGPALLAASAVAAREAPQPDATEPQPKIHVDQDLIHLGVVPEGRTGEAVFSIENRGDAPLEILEAKTTCTCIRFEIPQRILPPGKGMFIPARYVTTGHRGRESGAITLTTNDPLAPRRQLVISVDIDAVYEMEPLGALRLQPQRPGLACEPALKLLPAKEGQRLRLLGSEMEAGKFEVRVSPYERDGRVGVKLTLVGRGAERRGMLRDAMILSFQVGQEKKRVRLPVQLPLLGELRYEPQVMARVNPTWRGRQIGAISVESVSGKPLEILAATAVGPIDLSVRAVEPQQKYKVAIRVAADAPPGPFGSMVTIVTDRPGESILRVPVYGNVYPWIWVRPEAVLLKPGPASRPSARAEVHLRWPVAAPVKPGPPTCDDPRLTAELIPGQNEVTDGIEFAAATLRMALADQEQAGSADPTYGNQRNRGNFQTTIRIPTGWDQHPIIEVPVFVRAR